MQILFVVVVFALLGGLLFRQPLARARAKLAARRFDPARYDLPSRAELDPGRAGPPLPESARQELAALAEAAWAGDWRPAAAYLDRAGRDWDERWHRVELLGGMAAEDGAWLTRWSQERPDSGDAATLSAYVLLHTGWAIRGGGYAREVSAAHMRQFQDHLHAAVETARRAAVFAPRDPGPWVVMVTAARGLKFPHGQFRSLWNELIRRAPHHFMGHRQALEYWTPKWHGTDQEMLAFGERAIHACPPGSPLAGVYLYAVAEHIKRQGKLPTAPSSARKRLLADVHRALNQVPEDNPYLPPLRHVLAHRLSHSGLFDEALDQFRRIGPWCGAEPWNNRKDPVAAFDAERAVAAANSTRSVS
ncbi:hypothetical protein ACIQMP_22925 [Streptomyces sp. NPDC091385]|uniref:hypothetical protein n=1 Tax=Streptomyces sp. NPDC091385 TaxID=3365997 RepID=UPI0038029A7D